MVNFPALMLENVSKTFRQRSFFSRGLREETRALQNVSLRASAGEVLGLLGPNGSGKSTTLKLISTALLPDSGRVSVEGFDTRQDGQQVRKRVGLALASERSFFPRLTTRENLEFFAALENVPRRDWRERAESVLADVGLLNAADKQVIKLSSGMHQRLAIARALIKEASILLLDEPSRSLDLAAATQLWNLIRQLSAKDITILIATHNFAEAAEVCDSIVILQHGQTIDSLTTSQLNERELRNSYLELISSQSEAVPA